MGDAPHTMLTPQLDYDLDAQYPCDCFDCLRWVETRRAWDYVIWKEVRFRAFEVFRPLLPALLTG